MSGSNEVTVRRLPKHEDRKKSWSNYSNGRRDLVDCACLYDIFGVVTGRGKR